nr:MAG TPA: hypothetical protein [Caudoviricetes sp.]
MIILMYLINGRYWKVLGKILIILMQRVLLIIILMRLLYQLMLF